MVAIRSRRADAARRAGRAVRAALAGASGAGAASVLALAVAGTVVVLESRVARAEAPLVDAPIVWYDDDRHDIEPPEEREPNLLWDGPRESVVRPFGRWTKPSRLIRHVGVLFGGDHVPHAANVNALDEVPNSSWFTNRIGLFPMTPEEVAAGPGDGSRGPSTHEPWTIVRAKTEGVTPGFTVRDGNGELYLIKFDPPDHPSMASGAGVISARLLYAAGYFVPDDNIVYFRRDQLRLGDDVKISEKDGKKRPMTVADIDAILADVHSDGGSWRAIASKFLDGRPVGPFDYIGRRDDDPNDRIDHEHRRELRGLYTFAAWIAHFDTKQHNSLDMLVEEDGRRFIRHHLIDFASTLGTGAHGPTQRWGYEYTVDVMPVGGRILALGIHEDAWRRVHPPEGLAEVGAYVSDPYDPREYKPLQPNPAFANQTTDDAYWAAKIISAFTDAHIMAACREAHYQNPEATRYLARVIGERRDAIARTWFAKIPPLEFFQVHGSEVVGHDLAVERGLADGETTRYRVRVAAVNADRNAASWSRWFDLSELRVDLADPRIGHAIDAAPADDRPFVALDYQVDRGDGWSGSVVAYVSRASGRVVAIDR